MKPEPILGAAIALVSSYLAGAFVQADWFWLSGIWTWERSERGGFLYVALCLLVVGITGGWMARASR